MSAGFDSFDDVLYSALLYGNWGRLDIIRAARIALEAKADETDDRPMSR